MIGLLDAFGVPESVELEEPAHDLHHRFGMDGPQGGYWSILISRLLLDASEHQPYSNGYFKWEDGKGDEDRNIIPQQLKHDRNESHSNWRRPQREITRGIDFEV